ncbi:MAG: T9SS type A sorting domain-containing protein [Candidatus Marinimicrobia bacterium]|nr:T9SS type A sorting domain-containing protein [Candidatus Neomarinimicrobiota bacterium]
MKSKILLSLLFFIHYAYATDDFQIWNGNQIGNMWSNVGQITSHIPSGDPGMEWPVGSGDSPVYTAGLWIIAGRVNGAVDIRSAAAEFTTENVPGPWGSDPNAPEHRIYKIRSEDGRANPDWDVWPVDQGAPWIDANANGIYDPSIDSPDVKGDVYYWTVFNDGNEERHLNLWATQPLDIEVTAAMYGFEGPSPLENTLFFEWNIRNAGSDHLDSVILGIWQDIDLGDATNDYPGSVPQLDLSYHYVGELPDREYGMFPPAVGFSILQGPIVPSIGDTAWVSGELIPDYKNLHSTAFVPFCAVDCPDPEIALEAYMNMQGRNHDGNFYINPSNNTPEPFSFTGNPLDGSGWLAVNETFPRDWRGILSTGPVSLSPGETQQMVAACVVSPGIDPLAALAALFDDVEIVREIYDAQFTNLDDLILVSEIDVPHNTESSGPFTFQFEIVDPLGQWSDNLELRYYFNSIWYGSNLSSSGGNIWEATLPDFQVTESTTMIYYLRALDVNGEIDYWPSGAPYNSGLFTFGPDIEPPVVAGLQEHYAVHHQLPFSKLVTIDTVYDNRSGINEIWLNWTIGGSDIMTAPMEVIDTNDVDWEFNRVFLGEISDVVSQEGDTVKYWVSAQDNSNQGNVGSSKIRSFISRNQETIGDFDHASNQIGIVDWRSFENGDIVPFSDGGDHWGNVIQLPLNANITSYDTLEMIRELDLSHFDVGWINTRMAANFGNENNYGLIQIKIQNDYVTIDSLTGYILPATCSYDLSTYLPDTAISLRLIAHSFQGVALWILDDMIFHTDPNLVGIKPVGLQPLTFSVQQNYPNPFNPLTSIAYTLPELMDVEFEIFDLRGRMVKNWSFANQTVGEHNLFWDGTNSDGELVSTGVYLGVIRTEEYQSTIKMVLLR